MGNGNRSWVSINYRVDEDEGGTAIIGFWVEYTESLELQWDSPAVLVEADGVTVAVVVNPLSVHLSAEGGA